MRTDVVLDPIGDVELGGSKSPFSVLSTFKETQGDNDLYEVDLSQYEMKEEDLTKGIYCVFPIQYTSNNISINVKYRYGLSEIIYQTGYLDLINTSDVNIKSSDLQRYISDFNQTYSALVFLALNKEKNKFVFYNGESIDFKVRESMNQNRDLILKATKSTLYNAQTMGVGLIDYLNSDLSDMDAIKSIIESFGIDGMTVVSMKINNDTGEIILQTKEV
ncbi:MAG: hypothetical protein ACRDD8_11730 [Bacteroidales bacterium]